MIRPAPDGAFVDVGLKGQVGGQMLQVESYRDQTVKAQPGFSGSPVWNPATGEAAGLLHAARGQGSHRGMPTCYRQRQLRLVGGADLITFWSLRIRTVDWSLSPPRKPACFSAVTMTPRR